MPDARIDYPQRDSTVKVPKNGQFFVAYGTADPKTVGNITGILRRAHHVVRLGKTLAEPPNWIIAFDVKKDGDFTLEIMGSALEDNLLADPRSFTVQFVEAKDPGRGVLFTFPASSATVPPNFAAYGTADPGFPVSGVMWQDMQAPFNGQQVQPPPNWVVQFTNVAAGNGYHVRVMNANAGTANCDSVVVQAP